MKEIDKFIVVEVIYKLIKIDRIIENCIDLINVIIIYNIIWDDNGVFFWCFLKNDFIKDLILSSDLLKILVFCM